MHTCMHIHTDRQADIHTYMTFFDIICARWCPIPPLVSSCIKPVCLVMEHVDMGFSGSIRVSLEEGYVYYYIAVYSMIISKH